MKNGSRVILKGDKIAWISPTLKAHNISQNARDETNVQVACLALTCSVRVTFLTRMMMTGEMMSTTTSRAMPTTT